MIGGVTARGVVVDRVVIGGVTARGVVVDRVVIDRVTTRGVVIDRVIGVVAAGGAVGGPGGGALRRMTVCRVVAVSGSRTIYGVGIARREPVRRVRTGRAACRSLARERPAGRGDTASDDALGRIHVIAGLAQGFDAAPARSRVIAGQCGSAGRRAAAAS